MEQVGPWQLEEELAVGGMGVVYRATHAQDGRTAAVKLLKRGDARTRASFAREVRALARRLHHASAVPGRRSKTCPTSARPASIATSCRASSCPSRCASAIESGRARRRQRWR